MKSRKIMSAFIAAALAAGCVPVGAYAETAPAAQEAMYVQELGTSDDSTTEEWYSEEAEEEYEQPVMSYTELTTDSVTLKWDKVPGAAKYRIYRYSSSKDKFMKYKDVTSNTLTVADLKPEKEYKFYVAALDKSGEALVRSEDFTVNTPAEEVKLDGPEGLSVSKKTYNSITLKWDEVSGASGYRVYKYDYATKKYEKYKNVTATSCKVTGLEAVTKYRFKVTTLVSDNGKLKEHGSSIALTVTTPSKDAGKLAAPTGLTASAKTQTSITLKWNKVSGAYGYRVYKYDASKGEFVKYKNVTATSCKVTGLTAGTGYKFKVATLKKTDGKLYEQKCTDAYSASTSAKPAETTTTDGSKVAVGTWDTPDLGDSMTKVLKSCGIGQYTISDNSDISGGKVAMGYTYFGGIESFVGLYFNSKGQLYNYILMIPTSYTVYLSQVSSVMVDYDYEYEYINGWYMFGIPAAMFGMKYDFDTECMVLAVSSSTYKY